MADNHSSEQVLQDSGTDNNSDPTEALDSEHIHKVQVDQESESSPPMDDQVEHDVGDAVKEDMFVDCPDELITANADHREAIVTMGIEESSEEQNGVDESGAQESIAKEYKEERELFAREVAGLHHQLKLLLGEDDGLVGDTPLLEMVKDCSQFVRTASEERLRYEAKMRELHAEIEGLNARVSELSMSNDVVASYLGSVWNEKDQGIEDVVNRMSDALGLVGCQEEELDGYGSGKIIQVEKSTLLLIDRVRQLEDENRKLVEQIEKDKEMVERVNAELANTKIELEQEKVRCANTREKLTMAVTKGKALVQHRDSLKQSLAEKTSELEKCLSELQEKSSALEAAELSKGELVRSENLVAYLQETLLQRDSILKMVEEILSQTGVPEELQSMDIIERFRWLVDERNVLKGVSLEFQNLKDVFSSIELPETVSSSDLEARVGWLKESFYRAKDEINTLQDEIAKSREAAHNGIDRLSASLSAELQEKDYLQTELADVMSKYEKIVEKEHQVLLEKNSLSASLSAELEEKDSLQTELADLMRKYKEIVEKELQVSLEKDQIVNMLLEVSGTEMGNEEGVYQSSSDNSALIQRCLKKIKEQSSASSDSSHVNEELFERVLSHLYVRDQELMLCDTLLEEEMMVRSEVDKLSNELKLVYEELVASKEEKGSLQKDLERSEEKSSLLREKLSMAVKKGKGLVHDRENLKNLLEEKKSEIEKLKLELQQQESAVSDCRDQINGLSTDVERIPVLEADLVAMKDQRDQLEQFLLERNKSLQRIVESIEGIVLPVESVFEDPVGKVNWLAGYVNECVDAKTCAEQELGKVNENASTLASKLAEAQATVRSLEDALSVAETNISRHAEEKREIEVGKTNVEQELKNAIEEAQATVRSLEDALSVAETNISRHAEEKREIEVGKTNVEQELKKEIEEAQATVRSLEEALLVAETNISRLAEEKKEIEVGKTNVEQELKKEIEEAQATVISLEEALSVAETNISRLAEEKKEIEVGKTNVEQELQKAIEEACSHTSKFVEACAARKSLEEALSLAENNNSMLFKEREEAQASRADAEMELVKVKEEVAIQTSKLTEAYKTIKSLEDSLSQVQTDIALLTEQNNGTHVGRTNLENELKKLQEEAGSQADKLADAYATIKSLEDAQLRADNDISVLESAKKNAEEEVLSLNSKLSAALEELAGTSGSLESRSVELAGHYNDLQLIMKDDTLLSKVKECFEKKFESLKNMDFILKKIRDRFVDMDLEELQSQHVMEDNSHVTKPFSDNIDNIVNVEIDNNWVSAANDDNISSHFRKTVEGFQSKNKILADKFEGFSSLVDEFIAVLFRKLQAVEDGVVAIVEHIDFSKQKTKNLDMYKQEQETTISMLEDDVKTLLSLCTDATRELQFQVKNNLLELSYVPELERLNHSLILEMRESDGDAPIVMQQGVDGRKHLEAANKLLLAARKAQALIKQFESTSNMAAATIEELQNKLKESRKGFEKAMEERDLNQNMVSKMEADVETLQNSCSELRLKLEDYQTKEDKLKEREAEVSSLYTTLSMKEQEADVSLLSASQVKTLFDKIKEIELPIAESEVGDVEPHNSAHVKKLFNIIDSVTELWQQVNLLSLDKEELESTLTTQILEIEHLKGEAEKHIRDKEDSEKMKNELSELTFGLENIIGMFRGRDLVDQKFAGVKGLLSVLEKQVMDMLLESENSKSKAQELGTELLASQKAVDELSIKVKLLEDSVQGRSAQPEIVQERNIFEAPSLPMGSEISEIEDAGSVGQNTISPVHPAAHVRTLRKGSTDHLAINIDSESERLINNEGTDEDKGHVFKSLNTSGLIPIQGKLMADRIDGIWVSGGRVLMSRPRARLGLIAYCLLLHIWLLGTIL